MSIDSSPVAAVELLESRMLLAVSVAPFKASDGLSFGVATNGQQIAVGAELAAEPDNAYVDLYDAGGMRTARVAMIGGSSSGDAEVRDIAMSEDGSFVAVWVQRYVDDGGFFVKSEVRVRRFDADGEALTPRVKVFTARSLRGHNALMPSVAMNDRGEFVVAYNWRVDSPNGTVETLPKQNVAARMYAADGELRHAVDVASSNRDEGDSDVAVRPEGRGFHIVYTQEDKSDDTDGVGPVTADTDIILARYRGDGKLKRDGEGRRKVAATPHAEDAPVVSISPDGSNGIVGWRRFIDGADGGPWRREARRYDGSGIGERFNVVRHSAPMDLAIFDSGVSVASLENGKGLVIEDPEDLTGGGGATIETTFGIMLVQRAFVAVGGNGLYAAVSVEELIDDEHIHVGYIVIGTVPEIL